jgi:Protein of unknown function (DUF3618)
VAQTSSNRSTSTALQARGGAAAPDRRSSSAPDRSVPQIKSDIAVTRDRLAGTVDQIADRVNPKNVAERVKAAAKAQVIDPVTGEPRYDRLGVAGGVVLTIVGIRVWRSGVLRRSPAARARRRRSHR